MLHSYGLFSVRDLAFAYDDEHRIFDGLNLEVSDGVVTTLIGANGSGKSTLFNLMTKNLVPQRGRVLLHGERVATMPLREFAREVAIVHQVNIAPDDLTVRNLVSYGRYPFRGRGEMSSSEEDERMVTWALETTGLSELAGKAVSALSGGQRQRVWIAMALAQGTDVLLLDEPTTYLDIRYQLDILELVQKLNREHGITVVMVLHDINQALYYSDEIIALAHGEIVAQGAPEEVVSQQLLRQVYGVDLEIVEVDGKPFVTNAAAIEAAESVDGCVTSGDGEADSDIELPEGLEGASRVRAGSEGSAGSKGAAGADGSPARLGDKVSAQSTQAANNAAERTSLVKEAPVKHRSKLVRGLWAAVGIVSFGLGALGAVLPFIPTTPFMLLAAFCFARSSDRLNNWFKSTKLYHTVLEGYVTKRSMTVKAKLSIIVPVTILMTIGFLLMGDILAGRIVLAVVWVAHIVYFGFIVKTDRGQGDAPDDVGDGAAGGRSGVNGAGKVDGVKAGSQSPKGKKGNPMIKTRLLELLSDSKKYIAYQVIWRWIGLLCQIVISLWAAVLLDFAWNGTIDFNVIVWCAIFVVPSILLRILCDRRATRDSYLAAADVKRVLRDKIYRKLLELGASYRESVSSSKVIQLAVEGVEQLEVYFGQYLSQLFYAVIAPLTLFAVLAFVDLVPAVVLLVIVPVIPLSIVIVQKVAKRLLSKYWGIYADLGTGFLDNIHGLTTLKIYGADGQAADAMDAEAERFRKVTMQVLKMQLNSTTIMDIGAYGGAAVGIVIALWDFSQGQIGVAGLVLFILLSAEFFLPMRRLGSYFHIAMNGMAASDNIFDLLDLPVPENAVASTHIEGDEVSVELDGVGYSYDGKRMVLDDVSMNFPAGSFKALVGVSGCGKSTVANLIMGRNLGYTGSISMNGTELSAVPGEELMRCVTMVTHASHLFKGTVRDNLALGNPIASETDMADALRKVGLFEFVQAQGGLDMPIEEGAANLSGGQRQRVALARALLHDTPAYLFDEATSSIDVESEEAIMEIVHELARDHTVILISHRLANVVDADEIFFMEDGRCAESGTHDELLALRGSYARLFEQQMQLESFAGKNLRQASPEGREVLA